MRWIDSIAITAIFILSKVFDYITESNQMIVFNNMMLSSNKERYKYVHKEYKS